MTETKMIRFKMNSFEDHELLKYVKSKVFKNINYDKLCNSTVIRPMNYVFRKMNEQQKLVFLSLKRKTYDSFEKECPICYTNMNFRNEATTNCKHTFCSGCLQKWLHNHNNICPICRTTIEYYNSYSCCANGSHEYMYYVYPDNRECFIKPFYSRYPYLV